MIVPMQEEPEADLVHLVTFAERERLADKAAQALAQREIPAFHVVGLPALFTDRLVLLGREHCLVRFPEVAEAEHLGVIFRNALPEPLG